MPHRLTSDRPFVGRADRAIPIVRDATETYDGKRKLRLPATAGNDPLAIASETPVLTADRSYLALLCPGQDFSPSSPTISGNFIPPGRFTSR